MSRLVTFAAVCFLAVITWVNVSLRRSNGSQQRIVVTERKKSEGRLRSPSELVNLQETKSNRNLLGRTVYDLIYREAEHKRQENKQQREQVPIQASGDKKGIDSVIRIVGGNAAALGEYPFYGTTNFPLLCGATLIHEDILLTAAHCETGTVILL